MSAESNPLSLPDHEPTRALLLAQALDACIQAERRVPGSAGHLIARQPAWARPELRRLLSLASSLDAAATSAVMSEEFRTSARARLMHRIAPVQYASVPNGHAVSAAAWLTSPLLDNRQLRTPPSRRRWIWRGGIGGLLAAGLLASATLTASANALPGEPLYSVKQVREEIGLRLAPDDQARALVLLNQADIRLDETARLLQEGRTDQVAQSTQRFDDALDRATTTFVVTIDSDAAPADPLPDVLEARLAQQQQQLQSLLATAPEPARADLREALVATERSRALVAEPQPAERHGPRPSSAAAAPTAAAEVYVQPTGVAEEPASPPPVDILAQPIQPQIADDPDRHEGRGVKTPGSTEVATAVVTHTNPPVVTARQPNLLPARQVDMHLDQPEVVPAPEVDVDHGRVAAPHTVDTRDEGIADQGGGDNAGIADDHDRVVAPPPNEGDGHERVAEQPAAPPQTSAVMTQRPSGNNDSHDGSEQQSIVADTAGGAHSAAIAHDDGGQVQQQPTQSETAHTPPSATSASSAEDSTTGDRHTSASVTTAKSDSGSRTVSTATSGSNRAGATGGSGATSASGSGGTSAASGSGSSSNSATGDHSSGSHQSGGGH